MQGTEEKGAVGVRGVGLWLGNGWGVYYRHKDHAHKVTHVGEVEVGRNKQNKAKNKDRPTNLEKG